MNCMKSVLFSISLLACLQALPAQAIMGEDYVMMKTYFQIPRKYPPEHEPKFKSFAELRKEMHPAYVNFYTDVEGKINKEYWCADGKPWTLTQANKIRDAIMRSNSSGTSGNSLGIIFYYSDGARVTYRLIGTRVISILAVAKDYDPGDLGKMPIWFTPPTAKPQFPKVTATPSPQVSPPSPR
jgi:hypothetical protein